MKKNVIFFLVSILFTSIVTQSLRAQDTPPYWSLAGNNATVNSKLGTFNNVSLRFYTWNTQQMILQWNTGNLGINTTNPLTKLHVNGFGSFGNSVTAANATRALNLVDSSAVMRVLRVHPTSAPAVELISRTSANGANVAYWDFYAEPSDASFRIRDRQSGGAGLDRVTISHFSGNMGIGTTAPQFPLDVRSDFSTFGQFKASSGYAGVILDKSGSTLNGYVLHRTAGATKWSEGTKGNDNFSLYNWSNGSEALTVNVANNYVGISNLTPQFPLDVRSASSTFGQFKAASGYAGVILDKSETSVNEYVLHRTAGATKWSEGTKGNDNFSIYNWSIGNEALTIDVANNNVGIGTLTPQYKLDVAGRMRLQAGGGTAGAWYLNAANTSEVAFAGLATDNFIGFYGNTGSGWGLGMNTTSGNVGVGTLSPVYKFVATNNTTIGPTARIENLFNSSIFDDGLYIQAGNNTGSGTYYAAFQRPDGAIIGTVYQASANSVSYNTTSDKRLKTNIHETKFGLADVKKIQVRDYNYINSKGAETGFIAQQLYEVFPAAVAVGGEDPKVRPWMVDYGRVTPLLVKAIQDLSDKNDDKENTIVTMQQQINALAEEVKTLKALVLNGTNTSTTTAAVAYLKQNIPNPATNSTSISYYLPANTLRGEIRITDIKGSAIKIYNAAKGAGQLNIKSGELAAGVYNYTLYADNKLIASRQMVVKP